MNKIFTKTILFLLIACLAVLTVTACNDNTATTEGTPEASLSDSAPESAASVPEKSPAESAGCTHKIVTEPAVEVTCTESGWTEGSYCEKCGKVFSEQEEILSPGHEYENGACKRCTKPQPSEGLEFRQDNNEYTVIGIGSCTDKKLVIPESYNGRAVTFIEKSAFSGNTTIESVVIPEGMTSIGAGAFENCTSLKSVSIGGRVMYLAENAFNGCTALTEILCGVSAQPASWSDAWLGDCTATVWWKLA